MGIKRLPDHKPKRSFISFSIIFQLGHKEWMCMRMRMRMRVHVCPLSTEPEKIILTQIVMI